MCSWTIKDARLRKPKHLCPTEKKKKKKTISGILWLKSRVKTTKNDIEEQEHKHKFLCFFTVMYQLEDKSKTT